MSLKMLLKSHLSTYFRTNHSVQTHQRTISGKSVKLHKIAEIRCGDTYTLRTSKVVHSQSRPLPLATLNYPGNLCWLFGVGGGSFPQRTVAITLLSLCHVWAGCHGVCVFVAREATEKYIWKFGVAEIELGVMKLSSLSLGLLKVSM